MSAIPLPDSGFLSAASDDLKRMLAAQAAPVELAEFVGAPREAVSKTLSAWRISGVIEVGRGGLTARDRAALHRAALQMPADPEAI